MLARTPELVGAPNSFNCIAYIPTFKWAYGTQWIIILNTKPMSVEVKGQQGKWVKRSVNGNRETAYSRDEEKMRNNLTLHSELHSHSFLVTSIVKALS